MLKILDEVKAEILAAEGKEEKKEEITQEDASNTGIRTPRLPINTHYNFTSLPFISLSKQLRSCMLYYLHGYQSSPTGEKATIFKKTLGAIPIAY